MTSEGIERMIDVSDKQFKEIEFNVVPLFDQVFKKHLQKNMHVYLEKGDFPVNDTLNRLKLKYQAYKSAYYLQSKRNDDLYPSLFTVDYNI